MNLLNINNHIVKILPNKYGGSEKKKTVILDDKNKYMLKFPDPIREKNRELSYMNNAFSEYIGCHIYESIGIPVQETKLGMYTTEEGKEKVACLCKDLEKENAEMVSFNSLLLESIDSNEPYSFSQIESLISNQPFLDKKYALDNFYNIFIVDAFIGNPDRHSENCAFYENKNNEIYSVSPVFDCGSCLVPLLSDNELTEKQLLNACYNTKSAIRDENTGARLSYRDYLCNNNNINISNALKRIVPIINLEDIHKIITDIPYITKKRKDFYIDLLDLKYSKVLLPALEKSINQTSSYEYKAWSSKIIQDIYNRDMMVYSEMKNGYFYHLEYPSCKILAIKMNEYAFIYNKEDLVGFFNTTKTNKNVANFVSVMKKIGFDLVSIYDYPTDMNKNSSEKMKNEINLSQEYDAEFCEEMD